VKTEHYIPYIWTADTGVQPLLVDSDFSFFAHAASGDAARIVGSTVSIGGSDHRASMWTTALGAVDLRDYLERLGADVTGWELTLATVMSADGTVVAGRGLYNGEDSAFIVTGLPGTACPADFDADGVVNSQDFFTYLTAFFNQDAAADFNSSGSIDSQDFFDFLAAFLVGC
jgi:hypothetical protein